MSLLVPAALLLSLLAIPILLLYMLKLRRREVQVSSTMLWQMLMRDMQANAPWQRLKRNLLLILQLLTLAALVLALARPAIAVPSIAGGSLVVILDASASMNAQDGSSPAGSPTNPASLASPRTRFEAARLMAQELIDNLPSGAKMTLILAGRQPRSLVSAESDKTELHQALQSAQPGQGTTDWQAAFALAAGAASGTSTGGKQPPVTTVVISDGGLPEDHLPPLPGSVRYLPVGQSGRNLAISALALRPAGKQAELFARVTNYGDAAQQAILSLYANNQLFHAQPLDIPAGQSQNIVLPDLPSTPANYSARITAHEPQNGSTPAGLDELALDDAAYAVYQPPKTGRTLLVTTQNQFLEQVLSSIPNLQPFRALADQNGSLQIPAEPFDLYVMDGQFPSDLPAGNLLVVNPPANDLFSVSGVFTNTANAQVIDHPLTRAVDWSSVHVRQSRQVQLPSWAEVLVQADGGPLVFAGETDGRRVAVITFDLHDSDLPLQVAYPILMNNLVQYLIGAQPLQALPQANALQPGDSLTIPPQGNQEQVKVTTPSRQVYSLNPGEAGAAFSQTAEPGIYTLQVVDAVTATQTSFAVNLFSPLESDIHPRSDLRIGQTTVSPTGQAGIGQRELWPWLAGLALILLLIEWWVFHRSQVLPADWLNRLLGKQDRRLR